VAGASAAAADAQDANTMARATQIVSLNFRSGLRADCKVSLLLEGILDLRATQGTSESKLSPSEAKRLLFFFRKVSKAIVYFRFYVGRLDKVA
jgi:hypothetical protein